MDKKPLLSICIPIYNRKEYLERMLSSFYIDKQLFQEDIHLFISDNCSTEDLSHCCEKYIKKGLNLQYNRNKVNLGSNGNFEICFANAKGHYTWLLGSDDIPVPGLIKDIVALLKTQELGVLHLNMKQHKEKIRLYHDSSLFIENIGYWFTFMSSCIFKTDVLNEINVANYKNTWLIHVPVYLKSCTSSNTNMIYTPDNLFYKETDNINNGGYDFVEVFVKNFLGILQEFVNKGQIHTESFYRIKKQEYKEFLAHKIVRWVLFGGNKNMRVRGAWKTLLHYYGLYPYSYFYFVKELFKYLAKVILKVR